MVCISNVLWLNGQTLTTWKILHKYDIFGDYFQTYDKQELT